MSEAGTAIRSRRPRPFDDEHEALRESFRRFCERELAPEYDDWRREGMPRSTFARLAEHGFVAAAVPEEHGGLGIEDLRFGTAIVEEAMSAGMAGLALMLVEHDAVCLPLLLKLSRGEDSEGWMAGLSSGELVVALARPQDGLRGHRTGETLTIEGAAPGVINGAYADVVIAAAAVEDGPSPVLVALPTDTEGLTRSQPPELIGPAPCDRAEIRFDGVEAPAAGALEGEEAARLLARTLAAERVALAAMGVAGARAALEHTVAYVKDRRAFGRPIAEFENTRFALAGAAAEIEATGCFVDTCIAEGAAEELGDSSAAAAALRATELFGRTVDWGVQLHGGYGYMLEYPIAHAFMDARFLRLHAGGSEELKRALASSVGL